MADNWADKKTFACRTCQWFQLKEASRALSGGGPGVDDPEQFSIGRCRRHAPTMSGFPVVHLTDWCGDHKLGSPPR